MQTDQQKIHVLHIPRWYPHRDDPMLGLFVKNHVESLAAKCDNSILYLHFLEKQESVLRLEDSTENDIFSCIAYIRKAACMIRFLNPLINALRYFMAFRRCYKEIRKMEGKPDLIHVHVLTRTAMMALCIKWMQGIPYLISEHWSRYFPKHSDFKGLLRKFITSFVIKKSFSLICVSESLRKAMQAQGLKHTKYHTIPNAVDTKLFKPIALKTGRQITQLIHISCFEDKSKNISGLLKAIQQVKKTNPALKLDLLGDGEDKEAMESLANELGLSKKDIVFYGMLMPEEVVKKLQHSDYLIQTSHYETFSTVIAESLACGIPVISTPVGIFPEIYDSGAGLMIPSSEPQDIAKTIQSAIAKRGSFNSNTMREIAVSRFGNEIIGESLFAIYRSILAKTK